MCRLGPNKLGDSLGTMEGDIYKGGCEFFPKRCVIIMQI
jgi:hypothetical protein